MKVKTLVIGGNHQNPLGVIESLGRRGIQSEAIIVCSTKHSFVLKSKYVVKGHIVSSYDQVFDILTKEYAGSKIQYIVYACCDDAAAYLDRHKNRLPKNLILPGINDNRLLDNLAKKDNMLTLALSLGLNVPLTHNLNKDKISSLGEIEYPCVTKSITSVGYGKTEFSLCQDEVDLINFIDNIPDGEIIQIQKYIEKEYEFQFLGCSLNGGQHVIIPGYTLIENALDFNNLTFLEYRTLDKDERMNNLIEKSIKYVQATNYTGLFSIEFIHGKDGKDYFLEMNFRNDGNGLCVTAAGTNLPYLYYLWASGGDYLRELQTSCVNKVYSVPEDSYFISMLKGDISFKKWKANMKKVNCYITYFKGNTKPFWELLYLQKRAIAAVIVKRILSIFKRGIMHNGDK